MKTALVSASLIVAVTIVTAVVQACGGYGRPAALQPGVVVGDQFVCVTTAGHLVTRDLKKGAHRDFTELKPRFLSSVDVADNRACVATPEQFYVIDLSSGKVLHELPHTKGPVSVGFVDKEHIFAAGHQVVEVFDLATGKVQHRIELRKPEPRAADGEAKVADNASKKRTGRGLGAIAWNAEGIAPCCRQENLLFVALPSGDRDGIELTTLGAVAVIDLRQGRVIEEAKLARGITGLTAANGRLLVRSGILSYGIPLESCTAYPIRENRIDVKSKDVQRYDLTMRFGFESIARATCFAEGNDLLVSSMQVIQRIDPQGKCVARKEGLAPGQRLLGVWNGKALLAELDDLQVVALKPVEEKPVTAPKAAE
jgi:hypothetical protein